MLRYGGIYVARGISEDWFYRSSAVLGISGFGLTLHVAMVDVTGGFVGGKVGRMEGE